MTASPDPAGLVREALRLSAIRLHQSHDPDHSSATFDKCPAMPCYQARRALAATGDSEGPHHRHPGGDNATCPACVTGDWEGHNR